jgi:hypothetical protein
VVLLLLALDSFRKDFGCCHTKTPVARQTMYKNAEGYEIHYTAFFHAFYDAAKADGILELQKGLVPAL